MKIPAVKHFFGLISSKRDALIYLSKSSSKITSTAKMRISWSQGHGHDLHVFLSTHCTPVAIVL